MAVPLLTMEETKLVQSLYDAIRYEAGRSNVCKSGCTVNTSTLPQKIEDIVTNLSKQGKCGLGHKQYYVFETCEELGKFGGTCDCQLQKGDLAVVIDMNGNPAIFILTDSYTSTDVGVCPNDGEVTSGTCARLKWVNISQDIHAVSANMQGNTMHIVMNEGPDITVDLPEDSDKYPTSANMQGNTMHIVMNEGPDITVALPPNTDKYPTSANMQGNTMHIVMNEGPDITVTLPQRSEFQPSAFNFSGAINTTYSPDAIIQVRKSGGQLLEYIVPSDGFYHIQSNMMLSYINVDASQHELDFLSLSHYHYIYVNTTYRAKSNIGMGIMSHCNPRSMTSGSASYSGRLSAGDKIIIKKKTRKCNTNPEKNDFGGYVNLSITKLSN